MEYIHSIIFHVLGITKIIRNNIKIRQRRIFFDNIKKNIYYSVMDYLSYIEGSFEIDTSNELVAYFANGTTKVIERDNQLNFQELCYFVSNSINRDSNYVISQLIGYSYYYAEDLYFVGRTKEDFFMFTAYTPESDMNVSAVRAIDSEGYYIDIDDYSAIQNYSQYGSLNSFRYGDTQYGEFYDININGSLNANNTLIFDYTSLHYETEGYQTDVLNVRGENVSYYNTYFYISPVNTGDLLISYGSPIQDISYGEYVRGYNGGYTAGWTQGNENGYRTGINSTGVEQVDATAFTFIGTAFNAVSNILSIEILPNITLGLAFSIPMVFVLIMTIFKLVRK